MCIFFFKLTNQPPSARLNKTHHKRTPMQKLIDHIAAYSLKDTLAARITKADRPFWCAFFTAFIALNILFIFHGAQYLFGDHDWQYIKSGVSLTSGLFEGRFTQFIFINLLTRGEILPIVNNLIGFTGYSLGLALLARYWNIPHTKQTYALFALFGAVTPYILSFMYFAFLILPVLSWSAVVLAGLIIAEKSLCVKHLLPAIVLFTLALGGYPPVINLIAVALSTRFIQNPSKQTLCQVLRPLVAFVCAAVCCKLVLTCLTHIGAINSSYYNLQTTPFSEWSNKALLVLKDTFKQFAATLPFIPASYKATTAALTICAALALGYTPNPKKFHPARTLLIFLPPLAALATLFISASAAETEFSPRIDFFGLNYAYMAMLALCLQTRVRWLKNLTLAIAVLTIYISANQIFEAQKVWKLGYDAEQSLYRRVLKRHEQSPLFNLERKYIIVQAGSPSFRRKYYHTAHKYESDDLLNISYTPGLNAGVMWNYLAPQNYADTTSYVYTFQPDTAAIEAIKAAAPYPAANSTAVGSYWILTILTAESLQDLKQSYGIK